MNRSAVTKVLSILLVLIVLAVAGLVALKYPSANVPVLVKPVTAGTLITATNVTTYSFPANAMFAGMVTKPEEIIGKTAAVDLAPATPLKISEFGAPSAIPGAANPALQKVGDTKFPEMTRDDMTKMQVPFAVTLARLSGGTVKSGDYVTVMAVSATGAKFLIQKTHVVAIQDGGGAYIPVVAAPVAAAGGGGLIPTGAKKSSPPTTLILALTSAQALYLSQFDPNTLTFLFARLDAPNIPDVPVGVSTDGATDTTPVPSAAPSPTPGTSLRPTATASPISTPPSLPPVSASPSASDLPSGSSAAPSIVPVP